MALIKCKGCEKEVDDKAKFCPNCGAPVVNDAKPPPKKTPKNIKILALLVIVLALYAIFSGGDKKEDAAPEQAMTEQRPERRSPEEVRNLRQIPTDYTIGCSTEEYLSQVSRAIRSNDNNALNHLLQTECIALKVGQSITVIDQGVLVSHIRAYFNGTGVELYVYRDMLANK